MEVSSKTPAVVTGGASGLGEATARALAAKGAKVAIFDMNEEKGEAVAKDIGGIFCKVNVTSDEDGHTIICAFEDIGEVSTALEAALGERGAYIESSQQAENNVPLVIKQHLVLL